jgi:hypothetical protein
VLASFDKQHETLITNNPDATEEINFVRTKLIKIGQLIQTSPPQNGNGVTWKCLVDKAENEKNILCKHLDGKALFTRMMRPYAAIHRELEDSLLPECAKAVVLNGGHMAPQWAKPYFCGAADKIWKNGEPWKLLSGPQNFHF